MDKNKIVFYLNDTEKIVIQLQEQTSSIHCCTVAHMFFQFAGKIYDSSGGTVQDVLESITRTFNLALSNELQLHESINKDIGYLWNEAYRDKPGFVYEGKEGEVKLWVGDQFRVWCIGEQGKELLSVSIYNDKNGSIVLEITPDYPWYNCDPTEYKDYIPYEEWIKSYKPLVIRTIPADVARQWIRQADEIVQKIDENITHMQQENTDDENVH